MAPTRTTTKPRRIRKKKPVTPPTRAELATTRNVPDQGSVASVPDAKIATKYIHRKIEEFDDFDILDRAFLSGYNVLIEGPTGPGKTMFTTAWAAERKKLLARVPSNVGIDHTQMFGGIMPTEQAGQYVWQDGNVTHVLRNGGVILINEVNFMPERIATVLFGLLDAAREIVLHDNGGEVVRAHRPSCWCDLDADACRDKWVLIVADMNPDYLGTRPLNLAFRNRWELQLVWDYDPNVEAKLIGSTALLEVANQFREAQRNSATLDTPVSTNMLIEFEHLAKEISLGFALTNFTNHFTQEERPHVKLVLDTHLQNLTDAYVTPEQVEADLDSLLDDADDDDDNWLFAEGYEDD